MRLLRGWWLYGLLAAATVISYLWLHPVKSPEPFEAVHQLDAQRLEWWPQSLDQETLQRVLSREPITAVIFSVLMLFALGMMAGGLVLGIRSLLRGDLRSLWSSSPTPLPSWSLSELLRIVILALLMMFLLPMAQLTLASMRLMPMPDLHVGLMVTMLILDLFVGVVILAFAIGKGPSLWQTFGLSNRQAPAAISAGLRGYTAAFPWLFALLFVVAEIMQALGIHQPIEPIQELVFKEARPGILVLTVLMACTIGPVVEELFFRGVLYTAIRQRTSRLIGMLISSAIFALLHTNLVGFLPIMGLGCLLAYLYERTGSIAASLAVHVVHNGFLISMALLFRHLMSAANG